jgi:hypothetical protein
MEMLLADFKLPASFNLYFVVYLTRLSVAQSV